MSGTYSGSTGVSVSKDNSLRRSGQYISQTKRQEEMGRESSRPESGQKVRKLDEAFPRQFPLRASHDRETTV